MKKPRPFLKTPPPAKDLEDKLIRTGQADEMFRFAEYILGTDDWNEMELEEKRWSPFLVMLGLKRGSGK